MKKTYEKPVLVKRQRLSNVTAVAINSQGNPIIPPGGD
ncbi:putative RiPP precursor (plasmid) [Mesorhizobium sp. INR15]|nr:putative RiPP precursor [Mesorhizobium sp. INR15]